MRQCHELRCMSRPSSLPAIQKFLDKHLASLFSDPEWLANIHIIADELASNIEKYAFGVTPSPYHVRLRLEKDHLELEFYDAGKAFDPTNVTERPVTGDHNRPIGRLGILLVLSLADEMRYLRQGGRNITTVTMHYPERKCLEKGEVE